MPFLFETSTSPHVLISPVHKTKRLTLCPAFLPLLPTLLLKISADLLLQLISLHKFDMPINQVKTTRCWVQKFFHSFTTGCADPTLPTSETVYDAGHMARSARGSKLPSVVPGVSHLATGFGLWSEAWVSTPQLLQCNVLSWIPKAKLAARHTKHRISNSHPHPVFCLL